MEVTMLLKKLPDGAIKDCRSISLVGGWLNQIKGMYMENVKYKIKFNSDEKSWLVATDLKLDECIELINQQMEPDRYEIIEMIDEIKPMTLQSFVTGTLRNAKTEEAHYYFELCRMGENTPFWSLYTYVYESDEKCNFGRLDLSIASMDDFIEMLDIFCEYKIELKINTKSYTPHHNLGSKIPKIL